MKTFAALISVVLASSGAWAGDDVIFAPASQAAPATQVVTLDTLADAPTMREHGAEVMAAAEVKLERMQADGMLTPGEAILIKGWFKELPFHRILDLKISFLSGLPDTVGACLQINPVYYVSIDACAGTVILLSGISAHITSRFLHWQSIKGKVNADGSTSYWGDEFGVGPSVGYRSVAIFGFDTGGTAQAIDTLVSAEWVHWFSRYFGMGLQLDAGATFMFAISDPGATPSNIIPNVKLSLGFSF